MDQANSTAANYSNANLTRQWGGLGVRVRVIDDWIQFCGGKKGAVLDGQKSGFWQDVVRWIKVRWEKEWARLSKEAQKQEKSHLRG